MREFRDRVAVVTGAASGIGRAFAERFAQEGMRVVLADVEEPALNEAARAIRAQGGEALAVLTNVADAKALENLAAAAINAYGKVHLLCNNAGVAGWIGAPRDTIWEATIKDWQWITGVNYFGVAHGIRVFVPLMLAHGEEGHVVNTSSLAGLVPGFGVYGATKHAVVAMSESLYRDLRRVNAKIGVTCLCPGLTRTRIWDAPRNRPAELYDADEAQRSPEMTEFIQKRYAAATPPSEIASLLLRAIQDDQLYLITSDESDEQIEDRLDAIVHRRNPRDFPPAGATRDDH